MIRMNTESMTWEEEKEKLLFQKRRTRELFTMTLQWLELLEDGENLLPYFKERHCRRIAIYGAAGIGRVLLKEIGKDGGIEMPYFLDKNAEKQIETSDVPVYCPEEYEKLPEVDMVVVTAVSFFESICENLVRIRPEIPVVSLKTIIDVRKDEVWYGQR